MMDPTPTADPPTQVWVGLEQPSRWKFDDVENRTDPPHKPAGGLWTSSYTPDDEYICDWIRWCSQEHFYREDERVYLLEPASDLDVLRIDRRVHLELILERYEKTSPLAAELLAPLDFEMMAEEYSALHLTKQGQYRTRHTKPGLHGWDAETYLWFDWEFTGITECGPITDFI